MGWLMPAETDHQDRVWMAFPSPGFSLGATEREAAEARHTWSAVANAIAEFEPVTVLVDPTEVEQARRYLSAAVDQVVVPLDDAWMRDMGPTFVHDGDGALAAMNWVFNGWGNPAQHPSPNDRKVATAVAEIAGVPVVDSALINEGGAVHVDGAGTLLSTKSVLLDPGRNPALSLAEVEHEFRDKLGVSHIVWFERGLTADHTGRFGTRGHVDILATMPTAGRVLVHDQRDTGHPDYAISQELRETLGRSTTRDGGAWDVIDLPAPKTIRDEFGYNDWSYVNHLVVNGAVIACKFDDPNDAEAAAILAEAYPGRTVVSVDARPLYDRGGGIHCITQQQPSAKDARP
jgi:agmatine deiminase